MASRTRGHRIKQDIGDSHLLKHVPTTSLVRQARQPLFYELLYQLGFNDLPALKQTLAILYAQKVIEIFDILDCREAITSQEIELKIAKRLDLDKSYSQLIKLHNVLNVNSTTKESQQEGNSIDEFLQHLSS